MLWFGGGIWHDTSTISCYTFSLCFWMILIFHDRVFDPGGGFKAKVTTAVATSRLAGQDSEEGVNFLHTSLIISTFFNFMKHTCKKCFILLWNIDTFENQWIPWCQSLIECAKSSENPCRFLRILRTRELWFSKVLKFNWKYVHFWIRYF